MEFCSSRRIGAGRCASRTLTWAFTVLAPILAVCGMLAVPGQGAAQEKTTGAPPKGQPRPAAPKLGLVTNDSKACKGYTLLASTNSTDTYLVDMEGHVINTWKSD